ncbi:MAG: TAXI family TRAP transporter solute-binding subunit [Aquisalimonadaceae bacterium]
MKLTRMMSGLQRRATILAASTLVPAVMFGATVQAQSDRLTIAAAPQGTASYAAAANVAKVLGEAMDLRTRVQPYTGESSLQPIVNRGDAELGLSIVIESHGAYEGRGGMPKQPDLRFVSTLFPLKVGFFVRADSDIHSISDLRGKRVTYGYTAQGAMISVLEGLLANGGLTDADIEQISVPNVNRGGDDFAAGRADVFFHAVGTGKVSEVDASVGGLRMLPLDTSEEAMAAMREAYQYGYRFDQEPGPAFVGFDETIPVMAYDFMLLSSAKISEERVYEITRAMHENADKVTASSPLFGKIDLRYMYKDLPVPYHEGALRYYREQGAEPTSLSD